MGVNVRRDWRLLSNAQNLIAEWSLIDITWLTRCSTTWLTILATTRMTVAWLPEIDRTSELRQVAGTATRRVSARLSAMIASSSGSWNSQCRLSFWSGRRHSHGPIHELFQCAEVVEQEVRVVDRHCAALNQGEILTLSKSPYLDCLLRLSNAERCHSIVFRRDCVSPWLDGLSGFV